MNHLGILLFWRALLSWERPEPLESSVRLLVIFFIFHQYYCEYGVDCLILLAIDCVVVEITVIFLFCLFLIALLLACAYQLVSE